MSLLAKAKRLERIIKDRSLDARAVFYESEKDFIEALQCGYVHSNDINFIDDIKEIE